MIADGAPLVLPAQWRGQVDALLLHHGVVGEADSALSRALTLLISSWAADRVGDPVHPFREAHRHDPSQWGPTLAQTEMAYFLDDEREWERPEGEPGPAEVSALADAAWSLAVEQQHHHSPGWSMSKSWAGEEVRRAFEPFLTEDGDGFDEAAFLAAARRGESVPTDDAAQAPQDAHSGAGAVQVDVHDLADASRSDLVAHVQRLHSWDGLMELLDEHWPADLFPTVADRSDRDPGPRIVSLLRWLDRSRGFALVALDDVADRIEAELICCPDGTPCGESACRSAGAARAVVLDHRAEVLERAPGVPQS